MGPQGYLSVGLRIGGYSNRTKARRKASSYSEIQDNTGFISGDQQRQEALHSWIGNAWMAD